MFTSESDKTTSSISYSNYLSFIYCFTLSFQVNQSLEVSMFPLLEYTAMLVYMKRFPFSIFHI
jgi:hypothetical protein